MGQLSMFAKRQAEGVPLRLEDIADQLVTIQGVEFKTGNFGPYAVMEVLGADGDTNHVMTSAMLILDALENALADDAFPVQATFTRKGRCWVVV